MPLRSVLLASAASLVAVQAQAFTLNILHINDFHSRIESINAFDSTCSAEEEAANECFGGAARLKTAIDASPRRARRRRARTCSCSTAATSSRARCSSTPTRAQAELEMMNRIGYDAMAVGNHEFDLGPEPLAKFIDGAEFDVLSGNTVVAQQGLLARPQGGRGARLRRREGRGHRRDHARHRRDRLARPRRQLHRSDRVPDRQGRRARGRRREQDHRARPSRHARGHPRRRGGSGHRPDRRRPHPHAVLQHRSKAPPIPIRCWSRARRACRCRSSRPAPIRSTSARSRSPSTTPASSPRRSATRRSSTRPSRPTPRCSPGSRSSPRRWRS